LSKTVSEDALLPDRKVKQTSAFRKGFDYLRIVERNAEYP